ncbi:hypothetical protein JL722_4780 [Aureococcus anophagefferens]|nr:hypothetical protein JL722_4780 [Aureococcus anophagefferens]
MDAASALLGEEKGYGASGKTEVPSREEEDRRAIEFAMATGPEGLSEAEAAKRLEEFGPNVLEEAKRNELLIFLSFFWGPMPIMIWAATAVAAEGDWEDFGVLLTLQVVNGTVGFFEEKSAGDAIAALKDSLAPRASVKRSGAFRSVDASTLVPGDLLNVKLGDIVPADCKLLGGKALEVDQAALTGESLPAVVCFTGGRTFFGRAAEMVNRAAGEQQGRFAKVMFQNTIVLFTLSVTLCTVIYFKLMESGLSPLKALGTTVVILIACIPIAMQIVSTTVMAVGGRSLAEKKAILARGSARSRSSAAWTSSAATRRARSRRTSSSSSTPCSSTRPSTRTSSSSSALAKRMASGADAIDTVIVASVAERDRPRLDAHEELDFTPFDPVLKRTEATVRARRRPARDQGATKVVLDLCADKAAVEADVLRANQDLADRGFRSIGVAVARGAKGAFKFAGVISLFDPPRVDTKETLERARGMGIAVKMVTGDQTAIAVETSKSIALSARATPVVEDMRLAGHTVGMTGDGVNDAPALKKAQIGIAVEGATDAARAAADIVLTEPGLSVIIDAITTSRCIFARVRNYVIYRIACTLQIVFFFFIACLAFRPWHYYCSESDRDITGSYFDSCDYDDLINPDDDDSCHESDDGDCVYPFVYRPAKFAFAIPVIGIVIITILNDGCMLTIARRRRAAKPQSWDLAELRLVATVLGVVPLASSLLLLWLGLTSADGLYPSYAWLFGRKVPSRWQNDSSDRHYLPYEQLIMIMYLKISISDFLTLFASRTRGPFYERAPAPLLFAAFLVATLTATLLATQADLDDSTYPMTRQGRAYRAFDLRDAAAAADGAAVAPDDKPDEQTTLL